ncbi:MAG: hypothetical protein CMI02_17775 [Oceanospirillaceae bacterium]|nr:hypothetical protein [Oceanospirillaceae bacterium]MBT13874.1 hypothetical protein [Oceanospirillaceae bacterium]|tara:strand:+ start:64098 stop:64298 length:201 start_codon:yes stop_codon:yes gene_type:complete
MNRLPGNHSGMVKGADISINPRRGCARPVFTALLMKISRKAFPVGRIVGKVMTPQDEQSAYRLSKL